MVIEVGDSPRQSSADKLRCRNSWRCRSHPLPPSELEMRHLKLRCFSPEKKKPDVDLYCKVNEKSEDDMLDYAGF